MKNFNDMTEDEQIKEVKKNWCIMEFIANPSKKVILEAVKRH